MDICQGERSGQETIPDLTEIDALATQQFLKCLEDSKEKIAVVLLIPLKPLSSSQASSWGVLQKVLLQRILEATLNNKAS